MEIRELEDLGGKLEKEIDDRKKFWAELQILKNRGSTSSKLIDEIQNLETEMNSKEEELNKVKQKNPLWITLVSVYHQLGMRSVIHLEWQKRLEKHMVHQVKR